MPPATAGGPDRAADRAGEAASPGTALLNLVAVMDRLRRQCPWDARQTHESLAPFLLEETYEALEALEERDLLKLREELGDVLLQVLFHARVAAERTDGTGFTIDDVADGIAQKLIRRHPHVFAGVTVAGADEVKQNWDAIKARERAAAGGPVSALDGVPMGQPALSLAAQLQRRAERAGVPADLARLPVRSGADSDAAAMPAGQSVSPVAAELFELVARARAAGVDPELELRHASKVYSDRVRRWEQEAPG
jgi:MazG family protein